MQYEELPDDNYAAFLQLESEFRAEFNATSEDSNWSYAAADYMNKTMHAAKALEVEALAHYQRPPSYKNPEFSEIFDAFLHDVDGVIVQIRITNARHRKGMSVGFSPEQKTKIHALIEKIRKEVDGSNSSASKKEKLFHILSALSKETSNPRTKFESFGDLARGLAGLSSDIAKEGAEPWWKWFKLAMGVVDEAKESEPLLPRPPEIKRIEPPRKELPKPERANVDDDIPF